MGIKRKGLAGWAVVSLLSVTSLAAASSDLRLVEAAKNRDREAVRSLLKQHVDVNTPQTDGATALAWAAHWNDLETAELLIRDGAKVNAPNDYGVTPLSLACVNGSAAMVEMLLKAGANPNAARSTGQTPLMAAARSGNVKVVKLLVVHGADVNAKESRGGQTALMWAVAETHPDVVQALIEAGADVHARSKDGFTPFLFAAQQGDLDSARILLAAGANVNEATPEDGSALVVTSASGHEALSIFLLDKGADPNVADAYGITPLHYTVLRGLSTLGERYFRTAPMSYFFRPNMPELVKVLLAHGANPNARIVKEPSLAGRHPKSAVLSLVGATPFLLAAATYDTGIMRALVAAGADPLLATKENTTPLMMAAGLAEGLGSFAKEAVPHPRTEEYDRRALEAVEVAMELGADVNAANNVGLTALHSAAYVGSDRVVQFLVDKGAKVNAEDKYGRTPLSIAQKINSKRLTDIYLRGGFVNKSTADLLIKLGATPLTVPGSQVADVATR